MKKLILIVIVLFIMFVTISAIPNDSDKVLNQEPQTINSLWESYPPPLEITSIPYEEAYPAPVYATPTATLMFTETPILKPLPTEVPHS